MFENAVSKYSQWSCPIGGGTPEVIGKLHGMGCVIDDLHILTAFHCWSSISGKYDWPVVLRREGILKCEVVFNSITDDIIVLRCIERLDNRTMGTFKDFPQFSPKHMLLGSSVGFMSRLELHDSFSECTTHSHFANGTVSMMLPNPDNGGVQYTISSTVVQKGFSGSAVFRTDGKIVGVVVQMMSFAADITERNSHIFVLPVVAPIKPLIEEIASAIAM